MHRAPAEDRTLFATPGGIVDATIAAAADVTVWGDDVAVRALLASRDTSIQRPRRHVTAA